MPSEPCRAAATLTISRLPELRVIAERRVRLGAVVKELARRNGFQVTGREMEDKVTAWIVAQATVSERPVGKNELQELAA
jgi:FKBP-type peptidyl-prolyl cis-trans isomerase (trigger factor)